MSRRSRDCPFALPASVAEISLCALKAQHLKVWLSVMVRVFARIMKRNGQEDEMKTSEGVPIWKSVVPHKGGSTASQLGNCAATEGNSNEKIKRRQGNCRQTQRQRIPLGFVHALPAVSDKEILVK